MAKATSAITLSGVALGLGGAMVVRCADGQLPVGIILFAEVDAVTRGFAGPKSDGALRRTVAAWFQTEPRRDFRECFFYQVSLEDDDISSLRSDIGRSHCFQVSQPV